MIKKKFRNICLVSVLGIAAFAGVCSYDAGAGSNIHIINVSYDPTRELYESYNEIFKEHCAWKIRMYGRMYTPTVTETFWSLEEGSMNSTAKAA